MRAVQWPSAKRLHLPVQMRGHLRDLRLRQASDTQLLGEFLHPAGRDPEQVAGRRDGDQRLLGPAAMLQQPIREIRPGAQLRNLQLHGPSAGVPLPRPVSVTPIRTILAALPVLRASETAAASSA
jgi:hypothetical protein